MFDLDSISEDLHTVLQLDQNLRTILKQGLWKKYLVHIH